MKTSTTVLEPNLIRSTRCHDERHMPLCRLTTEIYAFVIGIQLLCKIWTDWFITIIVLFCIYFSDYLVAIFVLCLLSIVDKKKIVTYRFIFDFLASPAGELWH